MKNRIAILHATRVSFEPINRTASSMYPETEVINILDEGLSLLASEEGRVSERNLFRMANLIRNAEDLKVDGILLSCTIFSPYVDMLRSFCNVPLIAADVAMFEQAAALYDRIGVVVTFAPTVDSVKEVIERCKKKIRPFEFEIKLDTEAFAAAVNGYPEEHNRRILSCANELCAHCDAIVLAQMSHMRALPLFENFPLPVLTSPPVSLAVLMNAIKKKS